MKTLVGALTVGAVFIVISAFMQTADAQQFRQPRPDDPEGVHGDGDGQKTQLSVQGRQQGAHVPCVHGQPWQPWIMVWQGPPRSFWNEVPPGGHATRRSPMMADATVSAPHENRDSQNGDHQNRAAYERDEDRVLPASSASNAGGYRI